MDAQTFVQDGTYALAQRWEQTLGLSHGPTLAAAVADLLAESVACDSCLQYVSLSAAIHTTILGHPNGLRCPAADPTARFSESRHSVPAPVVKHLLDRHENVIGRAYSESDVS